MARAVRISRRETEAAPGGPPDPDDDRYHRNSAGLTRSTRLFGVFLLVLLVAYTVFLGLLASNPGLEASTFDRAVAFLSAFAALAALYGFTITLGRTPRGVQRSTSQLVVVEFLGTRRVFPIDGSLRPTVENRYRAGVLAPEATEMVAVYSARGPVRRYLVAPGMLPEGAR